MLLTSSFQGTSSSWFPPWEDGKYTSNGLHNIEDQANEENVIRVQVLSIPSALGSPTMLDLS